MKPLGSATSPDHRLTANRTSDQVVVQPGPRRAMAPVNVVTKNRGAAAPLWKQAVF